MKKIIYNITNNMSIFDSTDYIILKKDNQHISDKYIDINGKKINEYDDLMEGDLIVRQLYSISFYPYSKLFQIYFRKFKYYEIYRYYELDIDEIKSRLRTKNSIFNFYIDKKFIEEIFSIKMGTHTG